MQIQFKLLYSARCTPVNILASGLTPSTLFSREVNTTGRLHALGFDAVHLRDDNFCREVISLFSVRDIQATFLVCAGDAVSLVGTTAQRLLGLRTVELLHVCVGHPVEAEQILHHSTANRMAGMSADDLICTCIRAHALRRCGIQMTCLIRDLSITSKQLTMLGFELTL